MEKSSYCDICKNTIMCDIKGEVPGMDMKPSCYKEDSITFRVVSIEGFTGLVVPNNIRLKNELTFKYLTAYSLDKPMIEDIEQHVLFDNHEGAELILVGKDIIQPMMLVLSPLFNQRRKYAISTILTITVGGVSDLLMYADKVILCRSGKELSDEEKN